MPPIDPPLLEATRQALREHGYAGATMERIARAAGRSRVTLHRHGVTKDTLLAALVDDAIGRYRAAMWPALTGSGAAPKRLELALRTLCEAAEAELELLVALRARSDAVFHDERPGEQLTRTVFTEPLERLLRDGIADGSLRADLDPVEAATVLFNLVGWTYVHLRAGHGWPPRRARAATLSPVLHGLLAAGGDQPRSTRRSSSGQNVSRAAADAPAGAK